MSPHDAYAGSGPHKASRAARLADWIERAWPWLASGLMFAGMLNAPRIVDFLKGL